MKLFDYLAFLLVVYVIPCPCSGLLFRLQLALLPYAGRHEYNASADEGGR